MQHDLSFKEIQKEWHGTLKSYLIGFFASIILTVTSFSLVVSKIVSGKPLIFALIGLAMTQAIVQLLFFLHIKESKKPSFERAVFYFMVMVLFIIALGSLWIMSDLDDRVMSNMKMEMPND